MATPASLFRPNAQPEPLVLTAQPGAPRNQDAVSRTATTDTGGADSGLVLLPSAGAVEFDTVIAASGLLAVIPSVQRISMGPNRGGQRAHVWVDEYTVHILIDGELVKTVPSNLNAEDLRDLSMRGARPAGPPPATASVARAGTLPAATVIEVDRLVDINGNAELAKHRLKIGAELARRKVTLRLDGYLMHVVFNDVLAKMLPSPIPADQYTKIRGARIAATQLPPQPAGPMSVQRKVPRDGVVIVARQRLRIGRTYTGKIVTIHVEDTHFRVACDGAQLSIHPRTTELPIRRWKAKIHAPRPKPPT
jgi:hypothetical protein